MHPCTRNDFTAVRWALFLRRGPRSLFVVRRFPVLLLYEDYARARNTSAVS